MIEGWTETCRSVVSPWECDVTEHFTIAYYFDRLADAAATIEDSLGLRGVTRSADRSFDVRFVRELRAGASFHIVSAPIGLDEGSVCLGHQILRLRATERSPPGSSRLSTKIAPCRRISRPAFGAVVWPIGKALSSSAGRSRALAEGFIPTVRDRVKPMDLDARRRLLAGRVCSPLYRRHHPSAGRDRRYVVLHGVRAPRLFDLRAAIAHDRLAAAGGSRYWSKPASCISAIRRSALSIACAIP